MLLDIWLPKMSGIEVLKKIKAMEESPQVVMISGHGTIETAVTATKLGAHDFLEKPLSLEKVVLTVRNALRQKKLEEENILLRERQRGRYYLIGESPSIQKLRGEIDLAAQSGGPVLIYGENGTGKGTGRPSHPSAQPAQGEAVRRGQLLGRARGDDGDGALRLSQGRLPPGDQG